MNARLSSMLVAGLACSLASQALAQSNVDPANKAAWSENCGWTNWFDAGNPNGTQGANFNVVSGFASGFVWGENIGWINLGNGAGPYANTNNTNFGVNINTVTGALTGFAWGENVGWINFGGGAAATPAQPARVDFSASRLRGFAWGENIGWINLDVATAGKFVGLNLGVVCNDIDVNNDGSSFDPTDIDAFLSVFSEGPCIPAAAICDDIDFNNDGSVFDPCDIDSFLLVYSEGPCTACGL